MSDNGRMRVNIYDHLGICTDVQLEELKELNENMVVFYQKLIDEVVSLVGRFPGARMAEVSAEVLVHHQVGLDKHVSYMRKLQAEVDKRNN